MGPETLWCVIFFSKNKVRPLYNELNTFLVYLNKLTQLIAITDSMLNFGKFQKNLRGTDFHL